MSAQPHILLVSDQQSEAERVRADLGVVAGGRDILLIPDVETALNLIDTEKADLVFSHLSSGALASTFFLHEVWKRNPQSARFLLDSNASSEALMRCVLGGHQFVQMPVDQSTLKSALDRAESLKRFLRNDRIQSSISRMRTLPPRPSLYPQVLKEVRSSGGSSIVVGDLVAKDLPVSTKLLQLVNSPYYGASQPITEVRDAVVFLGLETTVAVVLSIETFAKFDKLKPLLFSVDCVWKHSQLVGDAVRKICRMMNANDELSAHAYLGALLHDIGQLAYAVNLGDEYDEAVKLAGKQKRSLFEIELELFGATHAETGAYLLAIWGLPIPVVDAVANHHSAHGLLGESFSPAIALHLAEQLMEGSERASDILERYEPELGFRDHVAEIESLLPAGMRKAKQPTIFSPAANEASEQGSEFASSNGRIGGRRSGPIARLFRWRP